MAQLNVTFFIKVTAAQGRIKSTLITLPYNLMLLRTQRLKTQTSQLSVLAHSKKKVAQKDLYACHVLCINIMYEFGPTDIKVPFNYSCTQL